MTQRLPRYMILILEMFRRHTGDKDDCRCAISMLPKNLTEAERRVMEEIIADYIGYTIQQILKLEERIDFDILAEQESEEFRD